MEGVALTVIFSVFFISETFFSSTTSFLVSTLLISFFFTLFIFGPLMFLSVVIILGPFIFLSVLITRAFLFAPELRPFGFLVSFPSLN